MVLSEGVQYSATDAVFPVQVEESTLKYPVGGKNEKILFARNVYQYLSILFFFRLSKTIGLSEGRGNING
jgi:hypothetical protein